MCSPLEQFEVFSIIPGYCSFIDVDHSFTISAVYALIIFFVFFYLIEIFTNYSTYLVNNIFLLINNFILFVHKLISENVGQNFFQYFSYILVLFTFLLLSNLIGMVPYTFTITSHLAVTFAFSFSFFFGINLVGVLKHGWKFLGLFLPSGAPLVLSPFLIIIEIISYIARVFSLAIRLFANMMSGHTLLKILAGFSWSMLNVGGSFVILALIPFGIVFLVTGLEMAIAFLQAYVFSVLACIYLNDAVNLH